ncbi:MAG TPA: ABC transporter ATP-binding protein [Halanaerobiales bacterium]|nr:ABC transporter ATP-binding protein [Halanaerobiales bacterium]
MKKEGLMMIEVKNLEKSYNGFKVLKSIDFRVEKGEVFGFLGKNGAGKTTTMNILTGLIDFDEGEVRIAGRDIRQHKGQLRKIIGYLPENPVFYDYLSGEEYLKFVGEVSGYDKKETERRVGGLLEQVNLEDARKRRIGGYSRGMKQRLALAVALFNHPRLLFLDEPTSALDPEGRRKIIELIEGFKESKITVFLSTHILGDAERVCNKLSILNEGKIILCRDMEELKEDYILPVYDIILEREPGDLSDLEAEDWVEGIKINGRQLSIYLGEMERGKKELLGYLARKRITVESLQIRRNTLEDIFIRMVNKDEQF